MGQGRYKLDSTLPLKDYHTSKRVVGYVAPEMKQLIKEDQRQHELKESEVIIKAVSEYYDRRPELVQKLKSTMGKHHY